jgi:ATP-binding cassette subfamily B (MDR/TAP) protein 1
MPRSICLYLSRHSHNLSPFPFPSFAQNILRQNIGFFDDKKHLSGILVTKLATDAATVHGLASSQLPRNLQMLTTLGCGIGLAFGYGWQLALVVIAVMPLIILAGKLQFSFVQGFTATGKSAYESANRLANEALHNVRTGM